jgi:predicted nucleic acid-binding protein
MEYWEVITRKITPEIALNVINFLVIHPHVRLINVFIKWNLVDIDRDDNKFSDCFLAANAHYLISNDNHLLSLKSVSFPRINVVSSEELTVLIN